MLYFPVREWHRLIVPVLVWIIASTVAPTFAHVHWTRTNGVDNDTIALYHFENVTAALAPPSGALDVDLALSVFTGAAGLQASADTPGAIFNPGALSLPATQTLRTTATVADLDGDLTIECWFKWTPAMTSSSLEIGLASGARLVVDRDVINPVNDRFGVAGTHGSYVSAPGFTDWNAVGEEEASLDEWRHLALAIHSTGIHYDAASAHDVYSTGTTGMISLNGHPVGFAPFVFDLGGLKVHDASRLTVIMRGGGMVLDEVTLWRRDWNENGAVLNPYRDGRGGQASIGQWLEYNESNP